MIDKNELTVVNENSIWYKFKRFFSGLFAKKQIANNVDVIENVEEEKSAFINDIKVEKEETEDNILNIKYKYEIGEVNVDDLTNEQLKTISSLYDDEINNLIQEITETKRKILAYSGT